MWSTNSTIFATKIIFLSPAPEEGAGLKCMLITRLYLMPNLNFKAPSRVRVKRDHSTWDKSADLASSYCMFCESFRRPPLFLDFYDLGSSQSVEEAITPNDLCTKISFLGEESWSPSPGLVKPFRALAVKSLDFIFEGSLCRCKLSKSHWQEGFEESWCFIWH